MRKQILICGDSFAADYLPYVHDYPGWPSLLSDTYHVVNAAQAGCSEYKIYKQLQNHAGERFDYTIIVHTSPFRIAVQKHPLHHDTPMHKHSDFIYLDVISSNDPSVRCVSEYFEKYHWQEHALFVHRCTLLEEQKLIENNRCLHVTFGKWDYLVDLQPFLDLSEIWSKHQGSVNHLSKIGNKLVFDKISAWLGCN